jgi:glycerol kinase
MVVNDWVMQFLADQLGIAVERPTVTETTALGAAYLAGLATGVFKSTDDIARRWRCERRFEPAIAEERRAKLYAGWKDAVRRVRA